MPADALTGRLGNLPGFLAGFHAIHVTRVSSLYASRPREQSYPREQS